MKSKIKRMLGILLAFCMILGMMPMNVYAEEAVVTFDSNGGSAVTAQSVQEGQTATEPVAPTKAGYTFMGWTRKGSPYDFSKPVTGNITLYARWGTTYDISAIPALNTGDSMEDDDLDVYFPASSSYNYLQSTPYWRWYDTSIPNGVAMAGVNYYAYAIMYLEDYSAVPYEGDFVVKYAGTQLSKLNSTEIYQDNMKSGYRIYMYDAYNVALQVRIYVGTPTGTGATYSIISGANSVYQKGSTTDNLSFTSDGDRSDFVGVEVDGSFIDVAKYDIEVDSTIIKLRKSYLESLSVGEHTLKIRYHDGAASTKFTVVDEEHIPTDFDIEVSLNGYSLGAKVADAYVSESSDTVDFFDFNEDGTYFCIFEDDGTGQSDWDSEVTEFEADVDYWLVVALTKQGGEALLETGLDADNATLKNGCVDKSAIYDDDLWWIEFKLNRLSENLPSVYSITFDANGGSVTPESATTGSDGKLTGLPIPTCTNPYMTFDGWYTGKTGNIKVTTDTVFTSDTTIYAHWNVDYAIEVTLNGYELGKKVADTTLAENSDSLDLDLENCHIFTDENGEPDWSSEVTEFEASVEYWLVVALTKQGGDELTSADLSADDVDLTNDYTAELIVYDDDLWWVSYKLKSLSASAPATYTAAVENGTGNGEYVADATVTITANTIPGKLFREWTTSDGVTFADSKNATTTFTMPDKDVTVTAVYDTIISVIDISGITPPVAGATPSISFTVSTTGVEVGSNTFWQIYDEATNTLKSSYEDSNIVDTEPFRSGSYVKLQAEVIAQEGYVFTPDTVIRYNGVELPDKDDSNLKKDFRYPVMEARRDRTAASLGWAVNSANYTVTFDTNGGSVVIAQTVNVGGKATKPADPIKEGFDFVGWTFKEKDWNFDNAVTGDMTLVAEWKEKDVTPPADDNDDDTTKPEDKPSDSPQTGDNSNMFLWIALLFVSGLGLVATVFGKKRFSAK